MKNQSQENDFSFAADCRTDILSLPFLSGFIHFKPKAGTHHAPSMAPKPSHYLRCVLKQSGRILNERGLTIFIECLLIYTINAATKAKMA